MKLDLDAIEAAARKAQEFHKETQFQYWSTVVEMGGVAVERFAEDCSPEVVLALVARIRELEAWYISAFGREFGK